MLRVSINLHPYGSNLSKTLNTIFIVNDGSGTPEKGNYVTSTFVYEDGKYDEEPHHNVVIGFDRDKGALALLYEVLKQLDEEGVLCRKSGGQSEEQITHSMKL